MKNLIYALSWALLLSSVSEATPFGQNSGPGRASAGMNINGDISSIQTLVVGTSGTDFAIVDTTGVHTFNLPTASSTKRGALSSTDWSTFNGKQDAISVLDIAHGGTNSGTALSNNRVIVSSSGAIQEASAITASRALISDANGIPTHATTTATEIGYVNGVTSAIQTQLNAKAPLASPTFSGTITTPLTASRALVTGSSAELAVSATTATQVGYLSGASGTTGTGNLVFSASPTFTGTVVSSAETIAAPSTATGTLAPAAYLKIKSDGTSSTGTEGLNVIGDGVQSKVSLVSYGDANKYKGYRASGTAASPTATGAQTLANFEGHGYDGSTFALGGYIAVQSGATWSGSDHETYLRFGGTTGGTAVAGDFGTWKSTGIFTNALNLSGLTASRAVVTDGSKNLASSSTTSTELGYVNGVTSAIQTQLDTKTEGKGNGSNTRLAYWTDANTLSSSSVWVFTPATFGSVFQGSNSGGNVQLQISNTSNTASSAAVLRLDIAGSSGGDAIVKHAIGGTTQWTSGLKASDSSYRIAASATLGTSDMFSMTTAGVATFTGAINGASGTAAAPGFAFSVDADGSGTGLYRSASNQMAFSANGTQMTAWNATNLDFLAASSSQRIRVLGSLGDSTAIEIYRNAGAGVINNSGANTLTLQTNSTDALAMDSSQKLTIATSGNASFHKVYGRGFDIAYGTSGVTGYLQMVHSQNTAGSGMGIYLSVAGTSAGDSFITFDNVGASVDWTIGMDTSDARALVFSKSGALGSSNVARVDPTTLQWNFLSGARTKYATTDVTAVAPTAAEMASACGTASSGLLCVINDNNGGTAEFLVWSDGTNWFWVAGTKGL